MDKQATFTGKEYVNVDTQFQIVDAALFEQVSCWVILPFVFLPLPARYFSGRLKVGTGGEGGWRGCCWDEVGSMGTQRPNFKLDV